MGGERMSIGWLLYSAAGLALCALALVGRPAPLEAGDSKGPEASPVKVELIQKRTVRPSVTLIGTAEPFRKSTVASEIEGLVVRFPVRKGQKVKKGDALARIEIRPLSLEFKEAEALLAEANENYQNALSELRRTEELYKKKTVSSRSYDDALYTAKGMKQRILALEANFQDVAALRGFIIAHVLPLSYLPMTGSKTSTS